MTVAAVEDLRERLEPARRALTHRRVWPFVQSFGLILLAWVGLRLALRSQPPTTGVFVYGGIIGVLYALVAFGLILVYRATRIINFAQAEMGASAGVLGALLIKVDHVPYIPALVIALAAGALSGFLVEVLVVRRFRAAPRLVLSVATIGVALVFSALQLLLPFWFGVIGGGKGGVPTINSSPPQTPFSGLHFRIDYIVFNANFIVIVFFGVVALLALGAFLKFTDIGLAVRAAAENADRATLLGIPIGTISAIVWSLAGMLSALGLFLRIPITGIPIGVFIGPSTLLAALAAAVIARMESFGVALGAGVALGMVEQGIYFTTHDSAVPAAVMLPILLAAMLLQRHRTSRGQDSGIATWQLAKEFRLAPPELRGLPEVMWGRRVMLAISLLLVSAIPFTVDLRQVLLATVILIYGIVAVSLVILTGWSGQISLGQWGFAGVGAAVAGGVATHLSGDFFVAVALAGLVGAAVAVAVGLPALRIQSLYLAVTTLALAVAVQVYLLNPSYFSWLLPPQNDVPRPVLFDRYDLADPTTYYFLVLGFLCVCIASATALRRSRAGRLLLAVRDNARGAQSYSVDVRAVRLWAFGISGFWAALAGALFAYDQGALDNGAFAPDISLTLLMIVVIGGSTSLPGAMLGTAYFGFVKYSDISAKYQLLATGFGALLLLMLLRGGVAQLFYGARDRVLRYVAHRRGIVVASLVADVRVEGADAQDLGLGATLVAQREPGPPDEPVLRCPQCGVDVPVSAASGHDHFAVVTP